MSSWTIVERKTADRTSAAPAIARQTRASGNENVARPNPTMARPHTLTAMTTARPGRRMPATQPDRSAPRKAPTPGAAAIRPRPIAPVPKTSRASAGKRTVGIPKTIAARSIANVERTSRRPRT